MECDVLIPAALEGVLHGDNAADVRAGLFWRQPICRLTSEGLTGSFAKSGISLSIPDILVNAGGVIASHFEWHINLQQIGCRLEQSRRDTPSHLNARLPATALNVNSAGSHSGRRLSIAVDRVAERSPRGTVWYRPDAPTEVPGAPGGAGLLAQ